MNEAMHHLTPTQIKAHERSKAFRARIDTLAQKLKVETEAPVPKIVERAEPAPEPAETKEPWFSIVKEVRLAPAYPSIATIQKVVSEYFGIEKNDLQSACREWRVAHPRQIAMYLCRDLTPKSLPEIGRRFGRRDHSTAHHAYHKVRAQIANDSAFAAKISTLKEMLA